VVFQAVVLAGPLLRTLIRMQGMVVLKNLCSITLLKPPQIPFPTLRIGILMLFMTGFKVHLDRLGKKVKKHK
jgi:hypothetical protein